MFAVSFDIIINFPIVKLLGKDIICVLSIVFLRYFNFQMNRDRFQILIFYTLFYFITNLKIKIL
jgi:hypothetical protein